MNIRAAPTAEVQAAAEEWATSTLASPTSASVPHFAIGNAKLVAPAFSGWTQQGRGAKRHYGLPSNALLEHRRRV
ncbi:MAG: hypothetical protein ABI981_00060 [Betaproteobacteria bacterium]